MEYLKVFATKKEISKLKKMLTYAQHTPVIASSGAHAMRGGLSGDVWQELSEYCHKLALKHGLPEIPGFYGCYLESGEFCKE